MKRIFAILMVLAMVFALPGFTVPAFAATGTNAAGTTSSEWPGADALYQYGFIVGDNGDLMTEKALTRAEACALLAEMYGKKSEAAAFNYTGGFSDVVRTDWYAPFVGYAKEAGWIAGYPDGTFGPERSISQQEWAAMLMKVLGYSFKWETAIQDILSLGIQVEAQNATALKRGEAFEAMWGAVNIPPYGETIALGIKLGKLDGEAVVEEPETPYIRGVRVESLKQVILIPSVPLDEASAEEVTHYSVTSDYVHNLAVVAAVYDDSKDWVTLTFNAAVPQQTSIDLEVTDVYSTGGVLLENEAYATFDVTDLTPPEIESADIIGTRAIKVVFSEPIQSQEEAKGIESEDATLASSVIGLLQGTDTLKVSKISLMNNQTEALVETSADITKDVSLSTSGAIRDYAGFSINVSKLLIDYTKDTEAPEVIGYKDATASGVTLIWSEDIRVINGLALNFFHSSSDNMVDNTITSADIDGNELHLSFTRNFLPTGKSIVTVVSNSIADYSGNKNQQTLLNVEIEADETAPVVIGAVKPVTESKVQATFSEKLYNKNGEVTKRSAYTLLDNKGKDISDKILSISYSAEDALLTVNFTEPLLGDYVLIMQGLMDYAENPLEEEAYPFTVSDLTPPVASSWTARLYNAGTSNQMVKIRFDEPMATEGKYAIEDVEKYSINGVALDGLEQDLLRMEVTDNDTSLEIYYPGEIVRGGVDFEADTNTTKSAATDVVIARVADAANNYISEYSVIVDLSDEGTVDVESATQTEPNRIEFVIADKLVNVDLDDFSITRGTKVFEPTSYELEFLDTGKSVLTLVFDDAITGDVTDLIVEIVGENTVNRYGEPLAETDGLKIVDETPAYVVNGVFGGVSMPYISYRESTGVITIRFSEDIDERTVSLLSFSVEGYEIDSIQAEGDEIHITVASGDRDLVARYDAIEQQVEIRDLSGNATKELSLRIERIN
jgi:hypothetical protein